MSEFTLAGGLSFPLITSLFFFWTAGIGVLYRVLGVPIAVVASTLKFFIPFSFFAFWGDGSWFIGGDDRSYLEAGVRLLESGENPISVWGSPVGRYILIEHPSLALYHWWNMTWMYLFGPSYSVVVFANVFTTIISSVLTYKIARTVGLRQNYAVALTIFFMFHWNILAWSSFLNIKEPLILLLILANIWAFLSLERGNWLFLAPYLGSFVLLLGIRFYLPALLGAAAAVYILLFVKHRLLFFPIAGIGIGAICWKYWNTLSLVERLAVFEPLSFLLHLLKAMFSPLPWQVTDPALYLIVPSALNLIATPLGLFGIIIMFYFGRIRSAFFVALIIFSGYMFYSLVPSLASVRHLFPFNALLIFFQFHLLWEFFSRGQASRDLRRDERESSFLE